MKKASDKMVVKPADLEEKGKTKKPTSKEKPSKFPFKKGKK